MNIKNKYLYCPTCKEFPDKIIEIANTPNVREEYRRWDGECYELFDTNDDKLTIIPFCYKCRTQLDEKVTND